MNDDEYFDSDNIMFIDVFNLEILKMKCCFFVKEYNLDVLKVML